MKILNSQKIGNGNSNIIILHGFLGMGDNWRGFAKKLDGVKFKINLVDQRNHGKSFWHESMSYEEMAEDLFLFCNSQNIDKLILIGHSMGGKTAMKFSLLFPEMVEKLIVVDIAPKVYLPDFDHIMEGYNHLNLDSFKNRSEIDNLYKTRHVKSLYMDTINKDLYLRSKYDDTSKFKFRYRQYDQEGDIFQEIKFSDFNDFNYVNLKKYSEIMQEYFLSKSFLKSGDQSIEIHSPRDLITKALDQSKKNYSVQRYKGLGEMNPDQLWQTTLDPEYRSILRVEIEDAQRADDVFEELMGDDVEKRKIFIQSNAKKVSNLDV